MKKNIYTNFELYPTGGTIDAEPYYGINPQKIKPLKDSLAIYTIEALLVHNGVKDILKVNQNARVCDSKDFEMLDICGLAHQIALSEFSNILITHGTDKMAFNARRLHNVLASEHGGVVERKKIVFTGALTPLSDIYAKVLRFSEEQKMMGFFEAIRSKYFDVDKTLRALDINALKERSPAVNDLDKATDLFVKASNNIKAPGGVSIFFDRKIYDPFEVEKDPKTRKFKMLDQPIERGKFSPLEMVKLRQFASQNGKSELQR
jgi:Asparaginase, N-terminal